MKYCGTNEENGAEGQETGDKAEKKTETKKRTLLLDTTYSTRPLLSLL